MAYTEILTGHGLTETQWNNQIFKEYLQMVWWNNLMGTGQENVIQMVEDLKKSAGDKVRLGLRGQMQGGYVTGNDKGIGNEGNVSFYWEQITVDNVRHVIKIEDIPMSQQRVGFDVLTQAKNALVDKSKQQMEDAITTALGDTSEGRVRGRYLYGAADSNWNSTAATALATIDATNDQLTTNVIDIAKRKALIPVNATARIKPTMLKNGKSFEEWFVFVGHTYSIRDLVNNDAAFRNAQLLIPPRANADSVLFSGSSFKGSWNGTLIYEYDRLALATNTNSVQTSHNFLLGAQACGIAYAQRPKFGEEFSDLKHDVSYETHEIRGIQKLVFNRSTQEDQGVVHVYAAAVAD